MDLIQQLEKQADIIRRNTKYYNGIEIKPITVGQMIAISPLVDQISLEEEVKTPEDFMNQLIGNMELFKDPIKKIFNELFECKFEDLLPVDVANLLLIVLSQIDTGSFINAIIAARSLSRSNRTAMMALHNELKSSTQST